jgi:hypothetical protein
LRESSERRTSEAETGIAGEADDDVQAAGIEEGPMALADTDPRAGVEPVS